MPHEIGQLHRRKLDGSKLVMVSPKCWTDNYYGQHSDGVAVPEWDLGIDEPTIWNVHNHDGGVTWQVIGGTANNEYSYDVH